MNRIDRFFGLRGEAKVKFLNGEFQVLSPGDFVRCAVTGAEIPLDELKYWSVERQEAYASPEAVFTSPPCCSSSTTTSPEAEFSFKESARSMWTSPEAASIRASPWTCSSSTSPDAVWIRMSPKRPRPSTSAEAILASTSVSGGDMTRRR